MGSPWCTFVRRAQSDSGLDGVANAPQFWVEPEWGRGT